MENRVATDEAYGMGTPSDIQVQSAPYLKLQQRTPLISRNRLAPNQDISHHSIMEDPSSLQVYISNGKNIEIHDQLLRGKLRTNEISSDNLGIRSVVPLYINNSSTQENSAENLISVQSRPRMSLYKLDTSEYQEGISNQKAYASKPISKSFVNNPRSVLRKNFERSVEPIIQNPYKQIGSSFALGNCDRFGQPYIPLKPNNNNPGPGSYNTGQVFDQIAATKTISYAALQKHLILKNARLSRSQLN